MQDQPSTNPVPGRKSFVTAFLLSFCLGTVGADRFYLGYRGLGILKLLTAGGLGIWGYIDTLRLAYGKYGNRDKTPLEDYEQNKKWAKIIAVVQIIIFALVAVFVVYELRKIMGLYSQVGKTAPTP